jgi:ubiquitin-like protein Pup
MTQSQIFGGPTGPDENDEEINGGQTQISALDSILDEIDTVLEENAESFVQGFVQKGGQ